MIQCLFGSRISSIVASRVHSTSPVSGEGIRANQKWYVVMFLRVFNLESDLHPGIETFSACLFKILLRFEDDLVSPSIHSFILQPGLIGSPWRQHVQASPIGICNAMRKWTEYVNISLSFVVGLNINLHSFCWSSKRYIKDVACNRSLRHDDEYWESSCLSGPLYVVFEL